MSFVLRCTWALEENVLDDILTSRSFVFALFLFVKTLIHNSGASKVDSTRVGEIVKEHFHNCIDVCLTSTGILKISCPITDKS